MNTRAVGAHYEEVACSYLVSHGYRILERNYRYGRSAELDIVARAPDDYIVFVEVKYRKGRGAGTALMAVDKKKQYRLSRAALYYLMEKNKGRDVPCRFDVIGINGDGGVTHIINAFEYCGRL